MAAQPPEIEHHRMETEGLRKRRPGVSITDTCLRSLHPISHARMILVAWHGSQPQEPHQKMRSLQEV